MKRRILLTMFLMVFAFFAKAENEGSHWSFNPNAYDGDAMSVTAIIMLDDVNLLETSNALNYELGAFCGDECRGSYMPAEKPSFAGEGYVYNLSIFGNKNGTQEITFRLYDHSTETEVQAICFTSYTFVENGDFGDIFEPVPIVFSSDDTPHYNVTLSANPTAGGTVTGGGSIGEGEECTITATANEGYTFQNWTITIAASSTPADTDIDFSEQGYTNAQEIDTVDLDDHVSVYFFKGTNSNNKPKYYNTGAAIRCYGGNYFVIHSDSGPISSITVEYGTGDGSNEITTDVGEFDGDTWEGEDTSVTFTVGGTSGHRRIQALAVSYLIQTGGGTETVEENPYTFNVTGATTGVANFEINTYEITVSADPEELGTVSGGGTYEYGDVVELVATPNSGYEFVNWTKNNVQVSTEATYVFDAEDGVEGEYVAHFSTHVYVVTVAADPTNGGTVTGGGNYSEGETCKIRAVAGPAHNFVNWTLNDVVVSTESNYTFTIADNTEGEYVANFEAVEPIPAIPTATHWTFDENTQYSMTITSVMVLDEVSMQNNPIEQYLEIGAFVGDECKGSFLPDDLTETIFNGYFYQMTIHSNVSSGEQIIFRVWNHIKNEEMDVTCLTTDVTFTDGDDIGALDEPFEIEFMTNMIPHYLITASANPAEGGIVTGSGSYQEDETCELEATANNGYEFVNWTLNDVEVSTEATYSFTVTEIASYVANFAPLPYEITASVNPENTGEITFDGDINADGSYNFNSQCILVATPATGYHFVNWTEAGEEVATDATYSFIVDGAHSLVANFAINTYEITVEASPDASIAAGGGSVEGGGTFEHFSTCTVTATPYNDRWVFENWTENDEVIEGAGAEYTFEVTGPRDLVANFAPIYTIIATVEADIDVEGVEPGTIEASGDYVENTQWDYIKGRTWTLTETPDEGYTFVQWDEVIENEREFYSDQETISEVALADRNFIATYTLNSYLITASVTQDPAEIPEVSQLTAGGYVTVKDEVFVEGEFHHYDTITMVAVPAEGYHFVNWTEPGLDEAVLEEESLTFIVDGPRDLIANFALNEYEIAVELMDITENKPEAAPAVPGTVTGAGTYSHYSTCTLVATPEVGYHFVNWTEAGVEVETATTYEFMVTEARNLVANFELDTHVIDVTIVDVTVNKPAAAPEIPGTVTGADTYNYYATCTLVATPEVGFHFVNWTEGGVEVGTETTYEFMVTEDRSLVANFELDTHVIAVTVVDVTENKPEAAPEIPGTVTGADTYLYYATCTLVATPEVGYHFVNWTEGGVEVGTETTYEFMVTEDRDLVANFELDTHVIAVTIVDVTVNKPEAAPEVPGTVTGADTYNYYATCTLVATPEVGYHFVNWTEGGVEIETATTIEFMVTEDRDLVANFELDTHVIAVTVVDVTENKPEAAPEIPGTVTGADTYLYYATCTLVATPEVGYHFVNWTEGGVEVGTETTYEFMVTEDRDLVANFELDTHVIAVTIVDVTVNKPEAAPEVPGTVTGADTYNYYATCTLVATPEVGYHFVNWTEGGVEIETATTIEFMVTEDRDLVANFELDTHVITTDVNDLTADVKPAAAPETIGTVTGADTYNYYATCTVEATPATGYHFVSWTTATGAEVSTDNPYSFMVTEDVDLIANFELDTKVITVTVAPTTTPAISQLVVAGLVDIDVDIDVEYQFDDNHQVELYYYTMCTLTATPSLGYHFVNWTNVVTGEVIKDAMGNPVEEIYTFMVTEERNIRANFELDTHDIAVNVVDVTENTPAAAPAVPGTVTGAGTYNYYDMCTLTATPATGYHFVNWTDETGAMIGEASVITYEFMVEADRTITANFELDTHVIAVTIVDVTVNKPEAAPEVPGTVTGADTYNYYATCTLVATPEEGFHFVNWKEGNTVVSTSATYEFMVTGDRNLVANFELDTHVIAATVADVTENTPAAAPAVPGTVTGTGTFNHYATCELTATPATGYHFVNWTEGGTEVSTSATYSFMVTEGRNLVANFELDSFEIVAIANPEGYGNIVGAGTFTYYATCSLTATATEGHTFVDWTENDLEVSTNATYSFMVTGPRTLHANFINRYSITAQANPEVGGTVAGAGIYNEGTTCTLVATPATGYHFVNWTLNGTEVSTNNTLSFTVTAAANYVANFMINSYNIAATVNPANTGTVTGAGIYNHFATCELTATPATGYHFVNWTENGTEVATTATYSFEVTGARNLVANFAINSYAITATVAPANTGTVTGAGTYNHFATCTMVATPATGYHFVNWTVGGVEVSTSATYSFEVTGAVALVANFAINSYEITVTINPVEGGTVTGAGTYNHFETCTLTATHDPVYLFTNWTLNGEVVSTEPTISFTVTGPANYVANFELGYFDVNAYAYPANTGTTTGSGSYLVGTTCTLTGIPAAGYHFVKWTKGTQTVSTDAEYSFEVTPESAGTYRATFARTSYTITADANPTNGGTVAGAGTYYYGNTCQLIATAGEGYNFVNWTKNGTVVSTTAIYNFEVTGDAHYVANFEAIVIPTYQIAVSAAPEGYGTVSGGGTYNEGETCTVIATATSGHMFVNWTENGEIVSEDAEYSFVVTANRTLVANFDFDGVGDLESITFTLYPNPATDKIMIESSEFVNRCEIYTVNGALVYTMYECTEHFEVNVNEYAAGSYIIRLFTDKGVQMRRFVKR